MGRRLHANVDARRRRRQVSLLAVVAAILVIGVVAIKAGNGSARRETDLHQTAASASHAPTTTRHTSAASSRSTTTSTTPSSTGTTATTAPSSTSSGVLSSPAVRAYLAGRTGDITAAVYDVSTGQTSLWRPGVEEYTASIVKVDILATLLHQDQTSGTAMSSSDAALATTMIEQSDDDAASDLWDAVGQQTGVGAFNQLLGLSATTPGTDGHWGGTQTTAADQIKLLKAVASPGQELDAASRSYELGLMENIESSEAWGVSAGVPSGVTLALKNGWLPLEGDGDWQVNSIGWVDGQGRDYLVAVLTKNNDTEGYGIDTIEGLSSLVWGGLAPTG